MIQNQRIIHNDNGTLIDYSVELNDFRAGTATIPIVAAEDYIYIGSDLPFNHRYLDISTANDQASVISVEIWYANDWHAAVDEIDRTASSGATLATSGILQWTTDKDKGWDIEQESEDVTGLTGTNIYNMYWIRLSFSADLKNTTTINYVGNKFSNDDELYSFYPDLNQASLRTAFETGKTNWNEQQLMAARILIADLKKRNIIRGGQQILDYELFKEPSIHKVAQIIYGAFGEAYKPNMETAKKAYDDSINIKYFNIDYDNNANLNPDERNLQTGFMRR